MTSIVQFRNENKTSFNEKYQTPLTYTPFIIDAVIKAVHEFPLINACFEVQWIINSISNIWIFK